MLIYVCVCWGGGGGEADSYKYTCRVSHDGVHEAVIQIDRLGVISHGDVRNDEYTQFLFIIISLLYCHNPFFRLIRS